MRVSSRYARGGCPLGIREGGGVLRLRGVCLVWEKPNRGGGCGSTPPNLVSCVCGETVGAGNSPASIVGGNSLSSKGMPRRISSRLCAHVPPLT